MLIDDTEETLTVSGWDGGFDIGDSLIRGSADKTGSLEDSNIPLGLLLSKLSEAEWHVFASLESDFSIAQFCEFIMLNGIPVCGSIWKFTKEAGMLEGVDILTPVFCTTDEVKETELGCEEVNCEWAAEVELAVEELDVIDEDSHESLDVVGSEWKTLDIFWLLFEGVEHTAWE